MAITFGSEYIFNNASTDNNSVDFIDSTHFVNAYVDKGNSNYGTVIIGTISSGNQITYGSEYVFNSASTASLSVAVLDATHIAISFRESDEKGKVVIGVISNGNQITFGSEYTFQANSGNRIYKTIKIDSTHFITIFRRTSTQAIIGTVANGTEISFGTASLTTFSSDSDYINGCLLDSTHFVVIARDGYYGKGLATIGTITSGTTITFGSNYEYTTSTYDESVKRIDDTHFIIAFSDGANGGYGTSIIGTVSSGNQITYGSKYAYGTTAGYSDNAITIIDSTHFVVAYTGSDKDGFVKYGTISGNGSISYETGVEFNNADTTYIDISTLDSTHFVVAFVDDGNTSKGTAIIGVLPSTLNTTDFFNFI